MAREALPTLLFCTSYMDSPDAWRRRYGPWVDHYEKIPLTRDASFLIDDASSYLPEDPRLAVGDDLPAVLGTSPFHLHRFANRLGRGSAQEHWAHWGWWRSFLFSVKIARRYGHRKIIHIESDAYLLSRSIVDYVNGLDAGWTTFWCPRHRMPEAAIQVIAEDQFPAMERLAETDVRTLAKKRAEDFLPFTHVNKSYIGNRYGEYRRIVPGYADFACQIDPISVQVVYRDKVTAAPA
jgi:hypothetical protein